MKQIALILGLLFVGLSPSVKATRVLTEINISIRNNLSGIDDGWYEASIKYTNDATGTNANYVLNVKVEYDKVVKIDFGNGGSVHSGYNNEGYTYNGGILSFERDMEGNTLAATTAVITSDSNGNKYFKIRIE